MKGCVGEMIQGRIHDQAQPGAQVAPTRPSFLCLVTSHDMQDLGNALARGNLPPDFEAKLRRLAGNSLLHRFVEQNCRLFVALLSAIQDGSFCNARQADRDRLLQVLAYVRKDDDEVPDYKPGGFVDDQREVRAATVEMSLLLQGCKAWRLRHQVPGMWLSQVVRIPVNEPIVPISSSSLS